MWLFDLQHLAGIDFVSWGQIVNSQELSKGHVVAFGDLVGAVTTTHEILVGAGCDRAFISVFRYSQALPYIKVCFFQAVQFLDFLCGGSISPGKNPE